MPAREVLLQEALLLPPGDRAMLVDALEESLDHGEFATPEIAAAWSEEIDRRLAAYDRGETKAVTVDQAMAHIRQSLAEQRAAQTTLWISACCPKRLKRRTPPRCGTTNGVSALAMSSSPNCNQSPRIQTAPVSVVL